jgi:hypothetical protein
MDKTFIIPVKEGLTPKSHKNLVIDLIQQTYLRHFSHGEQTDKEQYHQLMN